MTAILTLLISSILGLIISAGLGWNGFLISKMLEDARRRADCDKSEVAALREEKEDLEEKFVGFQLQVASDYVQRDDFVRHVATVDAKIDLLGQRLEEKLSGLGDKVESFSSRR